MAPLLLWSCSGRQQEAGKVLDEKKMQAVMWDMLQAEAFTQNYIKINKSKNDTLENAALQKKIFSLHKISRADFYTSYSYYASQPDVMRKILDSINANAQRDRNKIMSERYGGIKPLSDTL